jgi:CDP-diacylglycerol--glycerol-3-phosphate 3-phosphatidyltransferase
MLDGAVAREAGLTSRFGAFLDSTVDRYAEMFVFAGLLVYFVQVEGSTLYALLTFLAAGGSYMVSYTRARAEGLGLRCEVGLMERPERLILMLVAILIGLLAVKIALWVLTGLVTWTSWQRIRHVRGETRSS